MRPVDKALLIIQLSDSLTPKEHVEYIKWCDKSWDGDWSTLNSYERMCTRLAKLEEILCNRLEQEIWSEDER